MRRIARLLYAKTYHPRLVRFSTPLHHFIVSARLEGVAPLTNPDDAIWRLDTYESRTIAVTLEDAALAVVRAKQSLVRSPLEAELAGERTRPGGAPFEIPPYPADAGPFIQPRPRIVAFYLQSALGPRQAFPLRVGRQATFQIRRLDDDELVDTADAEDQARIAQSMYQQFQYPYMDDANREPAESGADPEVK